MKEGDLVVIHSNIGLRDRSGELGIAHRPSRPDAWEVETSDGSLSTYETQALEVIDTGMPLTVFSVPLGAVAEIALVQRAIITGRKRKKNELEN